MPQHHTIASFLDRTHLAPRQACKSLMAWPLLRSDGSATHAPPDVWLAGAMPAAPPDSGGPLRRRVRRTPRSGGGEPVAATEEAAAG